MTPRVTFILKRASSTLAEKIATARRWEFRVSVRWAMTWWQEFTKKSLAAPIVHLEESRKNHFTSQSQFRSENTPATIEADQILLALQQLANKNNPANFHNIINRISKWPKSLTTTMPTLDGKSEKFELFEDLFQTSLKIHNQLTEEDRINYFHSLMKKDASQTFKNINGPTRENLGETLAVFWKKYIYNANRWRQ